MTPSPEPTLTPTPNLLITATPTPSPTPTLSPTPTPDPYMDLYIDSLASRKYGGGVIQDAGNLNSVEGSFTRKLFKYRSEGLDLYGYINIPVGDGPFPVVVMLHGYIEPDEYATLDYSTRYADALAGSGFIVLHPNLRGYAPSPIAENTFGVGDTIDVLNLISLLRNQAGSAGLLRKADPERIGLWGHSMGGSIALRVLIIDRNIDAALLYASIHSDEKFNLSHFTDDGRGNDKPFAPDSALVKISPASYLEQINAPISIHHGSADTVVPVKWSTALYDRLEELDKNAECNIYSDQPHTFQNSGDTEFIANMLTFFKDQLMSSE